MPSAASKGADSVALDLHKWMQAPIDVGLALVRDEAATAPPFSVVPHFLAHSTRGLAGGEVWFNEYGIALSRGFRALRVWMALKAYGADAFGRIMDRNIAQAHHLAGRVDAHPDLERLAPVGCDVVCLRYSPPSVPPTGSTRSTTSWSCGSRRAVPRSCRTPSSTGPSP